MAEPVASLRLIESVEAAAPERSTPEDDGLALVAREGDFEARYRVWRGRSGQRYLVTVMPLSEAMRVEDAVVLLVATRLDGERSIIWAGESGQPMPGLEIGPDVMLEAHVHLLAASASLRAETVLDLINGAQGYSSVLTVSAAASHDSVASVTPSLSSSRTVFTT